MPDMPARVVFALLAIAFFATPVAARVAGVTPESFENRALADPPRLTQGWDAFQQATQYLVDRMPLRAQAVRANTQIWTQVFNTDPRYEGPTTLANDDAIPFAGNLENDDGAVRIGRKQVQRSPVSVRTGINGFAYLPEDLSASCDHTVSDAAILDRFGRLVEAVRKDGHQAIMVVAPSKASVYPEYLPEKFPSRKCGLRDKAEFWRLLATRGSEVGVVELRSELLRLKGNAGDNLFQRQDSHWTTIGALVMVDAILDAVGDGVKLRPSEVVDRGEVPYTGDLTKLHATGGVDTRVEYAIKRAPDAPRVPGRTLLICDSFAYKWMRVIKPYFEHIRDTSWGRPERLAAEIRKADTVIFEANETWLKLSPGYLYNAKHLPAQLAQTAPG